MSKVDAKAELPDTPAALEKATEQATDAPEPNDRRKARSPHQLSRPAWRLVFRSTVHGFLAHGHADLAGSLTYFGLLALAPSLVALVSVAAMFGAARRSADALLATIDDVAPDSAIALLKGPVELFSDSPAVGIALFVSILVAIWATSSYVAAFGRALNRIYEVKEGRPIYKLKPFQILIGLVLIVLGIIIVTAIVVSGPVAEGLGDLLHLGELPAVAWSIVKWPILVFAVVLAVTILNFATPNVRQPSFRWMSAGAIVSVTVLVVISLLFAFYVSNFAHYDKTYRLFAGVMVLLIWLWIANLTLMFGAEFDAQFERARELEGGIVAERHIQLQPRDTEASRRAARNRRRDIAEGRAIREEAEREKRKRK